MEVNNWKMQMNGLVWQKDSGNKEQPEAEKQRKKWLGKMNIEFFLEFASYMIRQIQIPRQEVSLFYQAWVHHEHKETTNTVWKNADSVCLH